VSVVLYKLYEDCHAYASLDTHFQK
jgi:hypothetical protein